MKLAIKTLGVISLAGALTLTPFAAQALVAPGHDEETASAQAAGHVEEKNELLSAPPLTAAASEKAPQVSIQDAESEDSNSELTVPEVVKADALKLANEEATQRPLRAIDERQTSEISDLVLTPRAGGAQLEFKFGLLGTHSSGSIAVTIDGVLLDGEYVSVTGPGAFSQFISLADGAHQLRIESDLAVGDSATFVELHAAGFTVPETSTPAPVVVSPLPITKPDDSNAVTVPIPGDGYHYETVDGTALAPGNVTLEPGQEFCGVAVPNSDRFAFPADAVTKWCFTGTAGIDGTDIPGSQAELAKTGSESNVALLGAAALLLGGLSATTLARVRKRA